MFNFSAKVERANATKSRDLRNLLPSTAAAATASTFAATAILENSTLNEDETSTERAGSSHHQLTIIETLKRVASYSGRFFLLILLRKMAPSY